MDKLRTYILQLNSRQLDVLKYAVRSWNHLVHGRYKAVFSVFSLSKNKAYSLLQEAVALLPCPTKENTENRQINLPEANSNIIISDEDMFDKLVTALDFYSRIYATQFQEISWYCRVYLNVNVVEQFDHLLHEFKSEQFNLPVNASYGMGCRELHKNVSVAYDLQQVIRHRLAWDRYPEGGNTVNFRSPLAYSNYPLAVINRIEQ